MRGNRHIDKYIREQLEDYPSEVPMDIWDKIDAKRSAREKVVVAPVFAWKKYLGAALLLLLAVGMLFWGVQQKNTIVANDEKQETSIASDKSSTSISNQIDQLSTTNLDSYFNSSKTKINNSNISEQSQVSLTKTIAKVKKTTTSQQTNISVSNEETQNSNAQTFKNEVSSIQSSNNGQIAAEVQQPILVTTLPLDDKKEDVKTNKDIKKTNRKLFGNALEQLSSNFEYLSDEPIAMDEEFDLPDVKCAAFQKRRSGIIFEADLFISPERAYRNLEASNEEYEEYTEKRNETESTYYSFSTGARLSVLMPNGLAARAGVVYSQINEIFDYVDPNATATSITYVLVDTIVVNMDTTFVIDTLSSTTTGTRFKTTVNRYNMIDIPIMLGFELELSKVVFNINGGVNFNVLFRKKGDILSPEMVPVSFSSNNSNAYPAFKDKLGVSLIGSVGINYKINNRLQLLFEPNFKYQFRPITLDNYLVKQKYFTTGFMTGLRFRF